ncbi:MAG: hypothetical protein WA945_11625 [Arcobacteraceae bacterium]
MEFFSSEWVMVIATLIYVFYTTKLFKETKKLREVETSPYVTVKIEPHNYSMMLKMEIENIGKAPAYDIDISFDKDTIELFSKKKYVLPKTHINYLPIGQKIPNLIGLISELKDDIEEFEILLKYKSKDGKPFNETIKINYKFMIDIGMLLSQPQEITKLDDIRKSLDKIHQKLN